MDAPSDLLSDPVVRAWLAKVPRAQDDAAADGFDARVWLAGYVEDVARQHAATVVLELPSGLKASAASSGLVPFVSARGLAVLQAWIGLTASIGQHRESWAREAADRAIAAYADRVDELMTRVTARAAPGEVRQ